MGMFDTVLFENIEEFENVDELQKHKDEQWQTKDLYNSLYTFVITGDGISDTSLNVFYRDRNHKLHPVAITGHVEIYTYDKEGEFISLYLDIHDGYVDKISVVPNRNLPHIPAMDDDNEEILDNTENFMGWLKNIKIKKDSKVAQEILAMANDPEIQSDICKTPCNNCANLNGECCNDCNPADDLADEYFSSVPDKGSRKISMINDLKEFHFMIPVNGRHINIYAYGKDLKDAVNNAEEDIRSKYGENAVIGPGFEVNSK